MDYENKKMLLTHIIYEIESYVYSYKKYKSLLMAQNKDDSWQIEFNFIWTAHRNYLRNLLDFFCWKNDDWENKNKVETGKSSVLYKYFSFATESKVKSKLKSINLGKLKSYINKSICHITEERYKCGIEIDNYLASEIDSVYIVMKMIIIEFIDDLLNCDNIEYNNKISEDEPKKIDKEIGYFSSKLKSLLLII